MKKSRRVKLGDLIIILILLVISIIPFYFLLSPMRESNNIIAVIKVDNKQVKKLSLNHDIVWKYQHGNKLNVVKVKNHKIRMIDANCKDQICVKDGWKSKIGDTIVCLPHKFLVELKVENENNE
ncbi:MULTISPECIES: NusG domain II-containing protein [unclassified Lactobacillus]|uniref:NusG domain II-containing protein n=1 Tax=unclassified Lactobacillus TaxID=2620435 RepID=UPI00226ACB3A|nr:MULTISPECIES: NusG domain II-containing protein [unclassified Lactobacillus]MCX8721842.1 NusG domain II-containing protein [Lactobacillus sp. B4010]MCX8723626.1 NusG domain II-containing protein [Lactobacillus sp. B4005]MCX8731721.1 NusG domain II-containing protein [Lactobacillus sp. B4015]MCX8734005.1 NusG domain II-containing protein [Lactobacillus sp. B4012]